MPGEAMRSTCLLAVLASALCGCSGGHESAGRSHFAVLGPDAEKPWYGETDEHSLRLDLDSEKDGWFAVWYRGVSFVYRIRTVEFAEGGEVRILLRPRTDPSGDVWIYGDAVEGELTLRLAKSPFWMAVRPVKMIPLYLEKHIVVPGRVTDRPPNVVQRKLEAAIERVKASG
jgi:hypothetical protein